MWTDRHIIYVLVLLKSGMIDGNCSPIDCSCMPKRLVYTILMSDE